MVENTRRADGHVDDLLSGFVDGELTQQQRQRVTLHCVDCAECRDNLDQLHALRERIAGARLSEIGEDRWRESMRDTGVEVSRGVGWLLFVAGLLVAAGVFGYEVLIESHLSFWEKFIVIGVYGGLAALLFSVLRQRLIERKSDKYKDVEI